MDLLVHLQVKEPDGIKELQTKRFNSFKTLLVFWVCEGFLWSSRSTALPCSSPHSPDHPDQEVEIVETHLIQVISVSREADLSTPGGSTGSLHPSVVLDVRWQIRRFTCAGKHLVHSLARWSSLPETLARPRAIDHIGAWRCPEPAPVMLVLVFASLWWPL